VIDDDWFKREHMRQELDRSPHIAVVHSIDQDTAASWGLDDWGQVDFAIVDVFDDAAPLEIGTDLFSGINALVRLRDLDVRTVAITPHRHHPLVEHRIVRAGANYLYRRWELNDPTALEHVVTHPDPDRAPVAVPATVLRRFGADLACPNAAVALYEQSMLYGRLHEGITQRSVKLPRRTVDGFTQAIRSTRFNAPPLDGAPRSRPPAKWAHVRDYLLVLLGRRDAPPSSNDEHEDLWIS
jgi:hypothetical protein